MLVFEKKSLLLAALQRDCESKNDKEKPKDKRYNLMNIMLSFINPTKQRWNI